MTDLQLNREPMWKVFYEAAILEFNPVILPQRIDEAKAAINGRLVLNRQTGDQKEHEQLLDALSALDQLVRMRGVPVGDWM